jgi:hypothetical protein
MRHPTDGTLRRLLDEPAGVADPDREHVAGCPVCLAGVAAAREDAAAVGSALRTDGDADLATGWHRLSAALPTRPQPTAGPRPADRPRPAATTARPSRWRAGLRRPAIAAVAFAVVLTGAGVAAANDWLQVFRTEEIAPVGFTTADLVALPDLTAYGDVEVTGDGDLHEVADAAAAAAETGLDVPEVATLPQGVTGQPAVQVIGQVSATFTYSADRAARAAAEAGATLPPPPPGVDGSQVRLLAGPGVAQVWSSSAGLPALVVGRAVAPSAFASGADFDTVRDHLLSLPGLPSGVAEQLRTLSEEGTTLPLPVPSDEVTTTSEDVDGRTATVLTSQDRSVAAVVWVEEGTVTAVAGSLDAEELLAIARGLS